MIRAKITFKGLQPDKIVSGVKRTYTTPELYVITSIDSEGLPVRYEWPLTNIQQVTLITTAREMRGLSEPKEELFTQYSHHGQDVWVRVDLKGKHRQHCLCHVPCDKFHPGREDNCPIAETLYAVDRAFGVTTPVWECPEFDARDTE